MDSSLLTQIWQIGGGLFAIAVVLFIGVRYYRKESSFSEEYIGLLDQYKVRNEELQKQYVEAVESHKRELSEMRHMYEVKLQELNVQISELKRQVDALKGILKGKEF